MKTETERIKPDLKRMTSWFCDGDHDVISRRKVLPLGESLRFRQFLIYSTFVLVSYHRHLKNSLTSSFVLPCFASLKVKKVKGHVFSYGMSFAIWDHTVLPVTLHKWTHRALTPARQAGTRFTYPGGMEGWVDLTVQYTSLTTRPN